MLWSRGKFGYWCKNARWAGLESEHNQLYIKSIRQGHYVLWVTCKQPAKETFITFSAQEYNSQMKSYITWFISFFLTKNAGGLILTIYMFNALITCVKVNFICFQKPLWQYLCHTYFVFSDGVGLVAACIILWLIIVAVCTLARRRQRSATGHQRRSRSIYSLPGKKIHTQQTRINLNRNIKYNLELCL